MPLLLLEDVYFLRHIYVGIRVIALYRSYHEYIPYRQSAEVR